MSDHGKLLMCLETPSGRFIGFDGLYTSIFKSAYQHLLRPEPTDHLYPLSCFLRDIAGLGVKFAFDIPVGDVKPLDLLVLFDCPSRKRLKDINRLSFGTSLILDIENPLISPGNQLHFHDCQAISPYRKNPFRKTDTSYAYKQIPTVASTEEAPDVVNTSIICSNLLGGSSFLYAFRRHVINVLSRFGPEKFLFYGKGWQSSLKKTLLPQLKSYWRRPGAMVDTFNYAMRSYPRVSLDCYQGAPPSKDVLLSASTSICIENTVIVPGYTTEKPLEPLIYGCLPIYVGTSDDSYLTRYLPVHNADVLSLVSTYKAMESMTQAEIRKSAIQIKQSINDSLLTGEIRTTLSAAYESIYALL